MQTHLCQVGYIILINANHLTTTTTLV